MLHGLWDLILGGMWKSCGLSYRALNCYKQNLMACIGRSLKYQNGNGDELSAVPDDEVLEESGLHRTTS